MGRGKGANLLLKRSKRAQVWACTKAVWISDQTDGLPVLDVSAAVAVGVYKLREVYSSGSFQRRDSYQHPAASCTQYKLIILDICPKYCSPDRTLFDSLTTKYDKDCLETPSISRLESGLCCNLPSLNGEHKLQ